MPAVSPSASARCFRRTATAAATDYIMLDRRQCEACWECVEACPNEVLGMLSLGPHRHADRGRPDDCTGCLACVRACEAGALDQARAGLTGRRHSCSRCFVRSPGIAWSTGGRRPHGESPTRQLAEEHEYVLLVVGAMEAEAASIERTGARPRGARDPDGRLHAQLHRRRPPHQGGGPPLPAARGAELGRRRDDQRPAQRARGRARLHPGHRYGASGRGGRRPERAAAARGRHRREPQAVRLPAAAAHRQGGHGALPAHGRGAQRAGAGDARARSSAHRDDARGSRESAERYHRMAHDLATAPARRLAPSERETAMDRLLRDAAERAIRYVGELPERRVAPDADALAGWSASTSRCPTGRTTPGASSRCWTKPARRPPWPRPAPGSSAS